jgi:hypothetical protein
MILTFMEEGARAVISFCIRSDRPGYMVVPPDYGEIVSKIILLLGGPNDGFGYVP